MPTSTPLFRELLSEGWFVTVTDVHENRITVECEMFSRDYDSETGYTDIVFGEPESGVKLYRAAVHYSTFELRHRGPAAPLDQEWRQMPADMCAAIAALITPANFPEAAKCMPEEEYPEDEDARLAFWASINQQVSSMTAAGDPWGALKVQREAVNKLIGWVDPPPEEDRSVPEPKLEDMTPLRYSLIEAADAEQASLVEAAYADEDEDDAEEDDYLPVGAHLLRPDFQTFLRNWNQTIAAATGDWLGEPRQTFKKQNPELWQQFRMELKAYSAVYAEDLAAVKAYQANYQAQEA